MIRHPTQSVRTFHGWSAKLVVPHCCPKCCWYFLRFGYVLSSFRTLFRFLTCPHIMYIYIYMCVMPRTLLLKSGFTTLNSHLQICRGWCGYVLVSWVDVCKSVRMCQCTIHRNYDESRFAYILDLCRVLLRYSHPSNTSILFGSYIISLIYLHISDRFLHMCDANILVWRIMGLVLIVFEFNLTRVSNVYLQVGPRLGFSFKFELSLRIGEYFEGGILGIRDDFHGSSSSQGFYSNSFRQR